MKRKKHGRPQGSRNVKPDQLTVELSICLRCRSTQKERMRGHPSRELEYAGISATGVRYTHVVWRRYRCLGCGQQRVERVFENRESTVQGQNEPGKK